MELYHYQYVGQYLRESRESLHITCEQAARALHIRSKYLRAIEAGNLKDLPGKIYIRGYIKNYAEFLGLEPTQILRAYETYLTNDHGNFFVPDASSAGHLPSKRVLNWSLIGIICVYGYWYFAIQDSTNTSLISEDSVEENTVSLDKYRHHVLDTAWKPCALSEDTSCFLRLRALSTIPQNRIPYYDEPTFFSTPPQP